jgi:LysR family nod box-dependent transcriptional activator
MNIRLFDLNLLVALDALLTERNVTHAGQRLGLSQPAMSGILGRLRHVFNDELLVRVGRRYDLTSLAEELVGPVRECVQEVQNVINVRQTFDPATEERSFRISASDYVCFLLLPALLKKLAIIGPRISCHFTGLDPQVGERLASGQLDFAILPAGLENTMPSEALFSDQWTCAVWSGHPSVGDTLTEEQFFRLGHLSYNMSNPAGTDTGTVADPHLSQRRRIVASTESFALAPFMLRGTELITLVHRRIAEQVRHAADIRLLDPPVELPPVDEVIVWNPRFSVDPAYLWMRRLIKEIMSGSDLP